MSIASLCYNGVVVYPTDRMDTEYFHSNFYQTPEKVMKKASKRNVCAECGRKRPAGNVNTVKYPQFKRKTLAQIAEETGIAITTLKFRFKSNPDITYKELTAPVSWSRKPLRFKGKTITEIAIETGIPRSTIKARVAKNPSISYRELTRPIQD